MENSKGDFGAVQRKFKKFGTEIDFQIIVSDESEKSRAEKSLTEAEKKCDVFEKIFSRFDAESEISHFNNNLGKKIKASPLMLEVAKLVIKSHAESDGYFDPRILDTLESVGYDKDFSEILSGSKLKKNSFQHNKTELKKDLIISVDGLIFNKKMDFSGIVKGFVVDEISNFFRSSGWKNFCVDCGGDMFFEGRDKKSDSWYIDVEGIAFESLMLELSGKGIATSGIGKRKWEIDGKRFHHLIDPQEPSNFSFDLKSVTVIDDLTQRADVSAKSIFLMGKEKGFEFAEKKKIPCVILDYKGNALVSSEIKKYLYKKHNE